MSEIFDEANMRQSLEKYIPEGETLQAGIHAIAKETKVTGIYGKCIRKEDSLVPDENGGIIALGLPPTSAPTLRHNFPHIEARLWSDPGANLGAGRGASLAGRFRTGNKILQSVHNFGPGLWYNRVSYERRACNGSITRDRDFEQGKV